VRGRAAALLAVAFALALAASISLTVEASEDDTLTGDVAVATSVQSVQLPGVGELVSFMNWAGRPLPMAALTLLVMAGFALRRRFGEALVIAPTMLTHVVNWLLKSAAESPRPPAGLVRVTDPSSGFGFPSGHTMAVVVFCGVIAYLAWTRLDRGVLRAGIHLLAVAAVLLIGFSRVYSGAHWPSDVLGAYLWGSIFVVGLVVVHHRLRRRFERDGAVPLAAA
jgi:undecaprenyl-diphosphatase